MAARPWTVAELFSGTGAFSLAFESTGEFRTVYSNDIENNSKKAFDENFEVKLDCRDIHKVKIKNMPEFNILTGGFPCQPFSIAGKQQGFDDERSNVFWKIIKIMKKRKPTCVVLENVKNLKSHDGGDTYKVMIKALKKIGYYVKDQVLNTCIHSKIPQNRERIYIVCFREKKHYNKFRFPAPVEKTYPLSKLIGKERNIPDKYYYTDRFKIYPKLVEDVTKKFDKAIYQYRRYYVRENKSGVCPTLTANMGTGGHNVPIIKDNRGIRKLTPRECFNLQGFPKTYKLPENMSDGSLYKLAGNAVSVPIVKRIAKNIKKALS